MRSHDRNKPDPRPPQALRRQHGRMTTILSPSAQSSVEMVRGYVSPRSMKRAAALREMASLGCGKWRIAEITGLSLQGVFRICSRHNIIIPKKYNQNNWLERRILRDFGKPGLNAAIMAERYGSTHACVRTTIYRLRKEGKLPPVQQRC